MDPWASDYCVSYATTHAIILLDAYFKFFIALLKDIINMYQLARVCMWCMRVYMYRWVCILHLESTGQHHPLTPFHLIFWDKISFEAGAHQFGKRSWPASPRDLPVTTHTLPALTPSTGITGTCCCNVPFTWVLFTWVLGSELCSLCVPSRCFP